MISRMFRSTTFLGLFLLFAVLLASQPALAGHGKERPTRQGILLVAFGTSVHKAQTAYADIEKLAREAFPDIPVRWAYTSTMIRDKLATDAARPDSPALALARMANEGFTDIAVQPLHVIPGYEYHELMRTVRALQGLKDGPRRVSLGLPLLSTEEDLAEAAETLLAAYPAGKSEAVVFIGHGTEHPASVAYPALQAIMAERSPRHFVGTVEGRTGPDDIAARLAALKVRAVKLVPLMSVAGDHAHNDIGGAEPESWASILTGKGIAVTPVYMGLASTTSVARLWIDHLRAAVDGLAPKSAH